MTTVWGSDKRPHIRTESYGGDAVIWLVIAEGTQVELTTEDLENLSVASRNALAFINAPPADDEP